MLPPQSGHSELLSLSVSVYEEVKHREGHSFNTQILGSKAHLTPKGYKKDMYKNMNIRARDLPRKKQTGVYEWQKREVTPLFATERLSCTNGSRAPMNKNLGISFQ